jgi:protein-S-isoprenylcysteine O-methyltransferase Ste14
MKRTLFLLYGIASYAIFLGVFLYAIGFLGDCLVPRALDSARPGAVWPALGSDLLLAGLFAVQHSWMARPGFKRWWTRIIPEPIERSTYVMFSNLAMILLFCFWQPLGGEIWSFGGPASVVVYCLYGLGWATVLVSTFLLDHFDLFGLRQVVLHFRGKPYVPIGFRTPGPYRVVRHPLYVGWLIVFWAAPTMSAGHLLLSAAITGYILIAIQLEERDLVAGLGEPYAEYRRTVPMLVPSLGRRRKAGFVSTSVPS